jgi:hypothetical protein
LKQGVGFVVEVGGGFVVEVEAGVSWLELQGRGGFVVEVKGAMGHRSSFKNPLGILESSRHNSFARRGRWAWSLGFYNRAPTQEFIIGNITMGLPSRNVNVTWRCRTGIYNRALPHRDL